MDNDLNELCNIPIKILLKNTIHKQFFTQEEFEKNYGVLMSIASLRGHLEKKLNQTEDFKNRLNKLEKK